MPLSQAKIDLVASIFAAAPDSALHRLEGVLMQARAADPSLDPVHAVAVTELESRRIVATVFEPLLPMAQAGGQPKIQTLKVRQLAHAWRSVALADPDLTERAGRAVQAFRGDGPPPPEFDAVCLSAADLLDDDDDELARLLRLCPVLRAIQPRLAAWTRNLTGEHIASVRLAFKDALAADENAGAALWEAIFAMLDQPWQVIRLISAAIDRPSDRYLASSELAGIGERLLSDVDARIASLKRFDPLQGEAGAAAEAASVLIAVHEIAEFEEWLVLNKEGPWGKRIGDQKRNLAVCMESRLRETEPAVAAALPTQPMRGAQARGRSPALVGRQGGRLADPDGGDAKRRRSGRVRRCPRTGAGSAGKTS
jgi:hypothetical protein